MTVKYKRREHPMFEKYVLLNVENPNTRGNSICAIAVVVVEDDMITDKKYSLINPEDRFDEINSKITGIDASQVQDAPTLKEYWEEIKDLLKNQIIVGHNMSYDLAVLIRALQRYEIEIETYSYCCTLELSRKYMKNQSHKLENLAKDLGYEYHVHNALEDALAAGNLFCYMKNTYSFASDVVHEYVLPEYATEKTDNRLIANLHNLSGMIEGILFDGSVNKREIVLLRKWIEENAIYKKYTLFAKIIDNLNVILEDNEVDAYDILKLRCLVTKYSTSKLYSETTLGIQILQGIIGGMSYDDTISEVELTKLEKWLADHDYLTGVYPYDKIVNTIQDVVSDGIISETERRILLKAFKEISDPMCVHNTMGNDMTLTNKTFCLTGEFVSASKEELAKKLKAKGAIEKCGVSEKLDYLFVGGMGSNLWKFGKIGGNIAKALELQEKGGKVQIVAEADMERILL